MLTAELALACALELLGRPASSFPPIEFARAAPAFASPGVEAYVGPTDKKIYVVTTSSTFRQLLKSERRCNERDAARKLASVLIHEEQHVRHNATEEAAYHAQLIALMGLGAGLGSPPYIEVTRAMQHTLARQRRKPTGLVASR
jgi:hypothetical protein